MSAVLATVLSMSFIHPCRHGRNERDCLICANEKVAKAVRDQTKAAEDQAARDMKDRSSRQSAEEKRLRQQGRESRAHERRQNDAIEQARRQQASTQAAESQRRQEQSEQRTRSERERQLDLLRQQVRATEAAGREGEAAALSEERSRWRAAYKQETGIYDEDLVEAAWLDHREQQDAHVELAASVERVTEAVAIVNIMLQRLAGLTDGWAGLPKYVAALPLADDRPVRDLADELSRLPRLSFRRGKLQEQLQAARAAHTAAQLEVARLQASNFCWEAAAGATQKLRTIWPATSLVWDEHLDSRAVALLDQIPAVEHEVRPSILVANGLDYDTEVRVFVRLVEAVEEVIERTAATNSHNWPNGPRTA